MIKNIISVINYFQWTNYIILFKSILVNIFYSFELFIAYESIAFYNKNEQTLIYGYLAMGSINSKKIFFIPTSLSLPCISLSLFFSPKIVFSLYTHIYTHIYIYIICSSIFSLISCPILTCKYRIGILGSIPTHWYIDLMDWSKKKIGF